jgi:hypothetical protein
MNFSSLHVSQVDISKSVKAYSITSLCQTSVAFIGADHFQYWYAATLMTIHFVGYDVLAMIGLIASLSFIQIEKLMRVKKSFGESFSASHICLAYRTSCCFLATVCGLIHRRHLMVWAIFAPKVL